MFRTSLRRLGRPAVALKTTSIVPQTRLLRQTTTTKTVLAALQSHIASRELNAGFRLYSTESAAATAQDVAPDASSSEPIDSFKDLHKLGVHRALTDPIVKGMGYDRMTPVQAKTIIPALKGTDM